MERDAQGKATGRRKTALRKLGKVALILALAGLGGFGLCHYLFYSPWGPFQFSRLIQERDHLEKENARLAGENTRLARTIDRLHNDPEMIQDLIRRELNFVKRNEVILQLAPDVNSRAANVPVLPDKRPLPAAGSVPEGRGNKKDRKGERGAKKTP